MLSRRAAIAGLLAVPAARAQSLRKVSLTLPFLAEGSNAFVFVTKAKGFWEELGLDVQIARGAGSTTAAQSVGTGQFQFGIAAATSVMQQIVKGIPIISIACCAYDSTMGLCVLQDSPIKTPADLSGHSIASAPQSGDYPFLPAFAQNAGFDYDGMKHINVDPNVRQRMLMAGQVDAISGFVQSYMPPLVVQKMPARSFLFSSFGLRLYNLTLFTQAAMLNEDPKLCEAMVTGLMKGLKFTALNPAEAIQLFTKQVPETALSPTGAEQIRVGSGIFTRAMLYDPMLKHGMGYAVPEDFAAMTDLVMKYLAAPGDRVSAPFFTNDFAAKVTFTDDEWQKAQSLSASFQQYLA